MFKLSYIYIENAETDNIISPIAMESSMMTNWFYMNRKAFEILLNDELGANLASKLISIDFDTPVSFLIGETSNEILSKIQETFSRNYCRKIICTDQCLTCSLSPPNYAKLIWFVQRLIIMSPLTKPFIKQTSSEKFLHDKSNQQGTSSTNDISYKEEALMLIIMMIIIIIVFFFCLLS